MAHVEEYARGRSCARACSAAGTSGISSFGEPEWGLGVLLHDGERLDGLGVTCTVHLARVRSPPTNLLSRRLVVGYEDQSPRRPSWAREPRLSGNSAVRSKRSP